uniref:C2H2-type domain-containing protein n=1 Tax=Branchiostoma floridae TaxID=7739 RepID=C3YEL0_BRAFL|eukprot:XP_002605302.1 hypothetical protein BRAFLDRAFT_89062 [Branchiostoma floridae]
MDGLDMDSEAFSKQSSQESANDVSSESEPRHADNPLIMRAAVPRLRDSDKPYEKLERVFRQEEEHNGAVCTAVEFWMDKKQTKCLIQVELRKNDGHGHYICPWPSCRFGRRAKHQVADHIRKIHGGPNYCETCGHVTKTVSATSSIGSEKDMTLQHYNYCVMCTELLL